MAHNITNPDLARIKTEMADKYERKARLTKSTPARRHYQNRANQYRRQAVEIARLTSAE